jgi:aspartyl/asparaginyl-tRNA synthetase
MQQRMAALKYRATVPELPFKRFTYDEVLADLHKEDVDIPWGEDISTEAFRVLGKDRGYYYFITDWPTHSKAFYIKPKDGKPELCEGFDLMWRWIELVSGGTRIADKQVLMERMKEKGLNPIPSSIICRLLITVCRRMQVGQSGWNGNDGFDGEEEHSRSGVIPRDQMRLTP